MPKLKWIENMVEQRVTCSQKQKRKIVMENLVMENHGMSKLTILSALIQSQFLETPKINSYVVYPVPLFKLLAKAGGVL